MKKYYAWIFISIFIKCSDLSANNNDNYQQMVDHREIIHHCRISKDTQHFIKKPKIFQKSNNLTRRSKDIFFSHGKPIIIEGYILDQNCVPITNTVVQIWQKNNFDFNQNNLHAKNLANNRLNEFDPHFASNGSNTSDNMGFYRFITIKPCEKFDITAKHQKFHTMSGGIGFTETFVENALIKKYEKILHRKLSIKQELEILCELQEINGNKTISSGLPFAKFIGNRNGYEIYRFDIVLLGREQYRKY